MKWIYQLLFLSLLLLQYRAEAQQVEAGSDMAFIDLTSAEETRLKALLALPEIATVPFVNQTVETTKNSPRGQIQFSTASVASGVIAPPRQGITTYVKVATASASDTVDEVTLTDYLEGDRLIFIQDNDTKPITFEGGTNNITNDLGDFTLTGGNTSVEYQVDSLSPKGIFEVVRHSVQGIAGCKLKCVRIVLSTLDVQQLNSSPISAIAAPGGGFAISVISATAHLKFSSIAYATNTTLTLENTSSVVLKEIGEIGSILSATSTRINKFNLGVGFDAVDNMIFANEPLLISVRTGDPTAGNSAVIVNITYRIITI